VEVDVTFMLYIVSYSNARDVYKVGQHMAPDRVAQGVHAQ